MTSSEPLIVTATFDPRSAALFQDLRNRHFPPERNIVPAHLSLFHNLPGLELRRVLTDLREVCAERRRIPFTTTRTRFLGRGCAFEIVADELVRTREALAARWRSWLTSQDRQAFRPHVTIQNKVEPSTARALCAALATVEPIAGEFVGIDLWFYKGGPWAHAAAVEFLP